MREAYEIAYIAKNKIAILLTVEGGTREEAEAIERAIKRGKFKLYTDSYTDETYLYGRTETGVRFSSEDDPLRITWEERGGEDFPARIRGTVWVR